MGCPADAAGRTYADIYKDGCKHPKHGAGTREQRSVSSKIQLYVRTHDHLQRQVAYGSASHTGKKDGMKRGQRQEQRER